MVAGRAAVVEAGADATLGAPKLIVAEPRLIVASVVLTVAAAAAAGAPEATLPLRFSSGAFAGAERLPTCPGATAKGISLGFRGATCLAIWTPNGFLSPPAGIAGGTIAGGEAPPRLTTPTGCAKGISPAALA